MNLLSYQATEKVEDQLNRFYEHLYTKENKLAKNIDKYRISNQRESSARLALITNIVLNSLLVVALFDFLC